MLPFEHDLVQEVKKVRQRSTSNSSEILMCRILAIPAELSCSQGTGRRLPPRQRQYPSA